MKVLTALFALALTCASAQEMRVVPMGPPPGMVGIPYVPGYKQSMMVQLFPTDQRFLVTFKYRTAEGIGTLEQLTVSTGANYQTALFAVEPQYFVSVSAQKYVPEGNPINANEMGGPFVAKLQKPNFLADARSNGLPACTVAQYLKSSGSAWRCVDLPKVAR